MGKLRVRDFRVVDALLERMKDEDGDVRRAAAEALGALHQTRIPPKKVSPQAFRISFSPTMKPLQADPNRRLFPQTGMPMGDGR